jgi:hypothetical protein
VQLLSKVLPKEAKPLQLKVEKRLLKQKELLPRRWRKKKSKQRK